MRKWIYLILPILLSVFGMVAVNRFLAAPSKTASDFSPLTTLPGQIESFQRAGAIRQFTFPQDHGPHPEFQTEWWYYTGNLEDGNGQRYGYQLTFFRRSLTSDRLSAPRQSAWGTNQVYLAHFALTDIHQNKFAAFEKLNRGAMGFAGAEGLPNYQVWLDNWSVKQVSNSTFHLQASQAGWSIELDLEDLKGPVLQGDRGLSQKGPEPGNASFYYSQTRLKTSGFITINNTSTRVDGSSWMDHEFSTSALSSNQVGWDWFALQLNDGSEMMVYQIRDQDGKTDPFSMGSFIDKNGAITPLNTGDFSITAQKTWHSSKSGADYPAQWQISVPSIGLSLSVKPLVKDQELRLSFTYWEGAVQLSGTHGNQPVLGFGYTELTGYAHSMRGLF